MHAMGKILKHSERAMNFDNETVKKLKSYARGEMLSKI